ncbi:MAG: glycosyltransferase family 2 protein, partial [Acidobacteriota bacterium]
MPDKTLDVQIVTYRPELRMLDELMVSLDEQDTADWTVTLRILDNSADAAVSQALRARIDCHAGRNGLPAIDFVVSKVNAGFGAGHNQLQRRGSGDLIL